MANGAGGKRFPELTTLSAASTISLFGFALILLASIAGLVRNLYMPLVPLGLSGVLATFWLTSTVYTYLLLERVKQTFGGTPVVSGRIPAPVTGLIASFFTGGFASVILILYLHHLLARGSGGKHVELVADASLLVATLGLYMLYVNHRLIRRLSTGSLEEPVGDIGLTGKLVASLASALIVEAVGLLLQSPLAGYVFVLSFSASWSIFLYITRNRTIKTMLLSLMFSYFVLAVGVIHGVATSGLYDQLFRDVVEEMRETVVGHRAWDAWWFTNAMFAIFLNNFAISAASAAPFIGSIPVVAGIFNAGTIVGVVAGLDGLFIGIMPHSILEFLGYSVMLSSMFLYTTPRKMATRVLAGAAILLLAAAVETLTLLLTA